MAILYTPKTSRFEQAALDKAIEMAERIIKSEQEIRIGESGEKQPEGHYAEIAPMRYFIFDKMGEVVPVWGEMFGEPQFHPKIDSKYQLALLVKILVKVLDSRVVLHITEGWTAKQCHNCKEEYADGAWEDACHKCGEGKCQPSKNPYCTEILMCNISHFKDEKDGDGNPKFGGCHWLYEILRDKEGKITGFKPLIEKEEIGLNGRMAEHWVIQDYEGPHFMLNYPHFCDALGVECQPETRAMAELVVATVPKDYPLLSWALCTDIDQAVEIAREQHRKDMIKFN